MSFLFFKLIKMSKFKEGDYVTLREDARYPTDGSLWSTVDDKLVPGELFRVNSVGRFSWGGKPEQDCVVINGGHRGYIPEICFDPVQIPQFEEGEWVECYRLPNENDWDICGQISYKFKVGEKYHVSKSSITRNIEILINGRSEGWYPPTVFRRTTLPVQELPQKWKVRCKASDKDTPELREWRGMEWTCVGYVNSDKVWNFPDSTSDRYIEISYETFLEKVYKPWKASQSLPSLTDIISLPDKWVYSLQNETPDRLKLIQEWRLSVCEKCYRSYSLHNTFSICNHEDGSYFYSGSASEYISTREGVIELTKEIFDKFVLQPWIDKGEPTPIIPQQETPKSSDSKIVTTRDIGARVVRGRDWDWGEQGNNTTGTIIEGGGSLGWTRVKWDNGDENSYRIGDSNKYDLYYAEDQTSATVKQYPISLSDTHIPSTSPGTTVSYQDVLSSTPKLIINKPKKRLLSTEVSELNVNLKLLKTP